MTRKLCNLLTYLISKISQFIINNPLLFIILNYTNRERKLIFIYNLNKFFIYIGRYIMNNLIS